MSGLHDALTEALTDPHNPTPRPGVTLNESELRIAYEKVRALLAEHPPADAPALDGPSYGDYWPPADLPVATGDAGTESDLPCGCTRRLGSHGGHDFVSHAGCSLVEGVATICSRCKAWAGKAAAVCPATSAAGSSPEPCDECEETGHNCPTHATGSSPEDAGCQCPPCPGRGNDGHGMTHCAECCFGTGVEADPGCPVHGEDAGERVGLSEQVATLIMQAMRDAGRLGGISVWTDWQAAADAVIAWHRGRLAAVEQERDRSASMHADAFRIGIDHQEARYKAEREAAALREQVAAVAALVSRTEERLDHSEDRVLAQRDAEVGAKALEEAAEAFQTEALRFKPGGWGSNPADQQTIDALVKALEWLRERARGLRQGVGRG